MHILVFSWDEFSAPVDDEESASAENVHISVNASSEPMGKVILNIHSILSANFPSQSSSAAFVESNSIETQHCHKFEENDAPVETRIDSNVHNIFDTFKTDDEVKMGLISALAYWEI